MVKAEKIIRNHQREKSQKERLTDLIDLRDDREDAYALNCILRRSNRARRKEEQAEAEASAKRPAPNFGFRLLSPAPSDVAEAKAIEFRTDHDRVNTAVKRAAVRAAPLLKRPHGAQAAAEKMVGLAAKRQRLAQHARMACLFSNLPPKGSLLS